MTPEQEDIEAAFPTRTGRHDLYAEAMRFVGERHAKAELVSLVNWLLYRIATIHGAVIGASTGELAELCAQLKDANTERNDLRAERDEALDRAEVAERGNIDLCTRLESAERELERWRHGKTIEGDFVCPNELRAVNVERELAEVKNTKGKE